MTHALPVPLPSALVDHHAVDLERKNAGALGMNVNDVATAPSGAIYALYSVSPYTYGVADDEADPAKANFGYSLLSRHAPDGTLLATASPGRTASCARARPSVAPRQGWAGTCGGPRGYASCPTGHARPPDRETRPI
ncbi:hypothetical protein [Streptomyces sp. MZ04]|uniref:hypothetical protein n=1 Tax=Streptomyces sp. MZ04 TaxID=2559236 RepID=UPI00107E6E6A|nr:hypothetical protein [Streptomyces sp. MZ04]TGB14622.1 hypothetical protein E2651_05130 [Streptomyces sp. MZ04]